MSRVCGLVHIICNVDDFIQLRRPLICISLILAFRRLLTEAIHLAYYEGFGNPDFGG